MAILQKNDQGAFQSTGGLGEVGQWVDNQNGISYSGPKRKATDVAYKSLVGQTQNLSQNPTTAVAPQNPTTAPLPIAPQQNQVAQSQGDNQSPMDKFNMAILDMLQKAQGTAGNEDLYARQRELQRKQIDSSIDYSGTEGMSPSAQENISNARAGEYSTEIDSIGAKIKANDSRLQNFESILGQMRAIGNDVVVKPSDEILQKYVNMIEAGGSLSSVPDEFQEYVMKLTSPETWKKQARSLASANASTSQPSSVQEYQYYSAQEKAAGREPMSYYEFSSKGTTGRPLTGSMATTLSDGKQLPFVMSGLDDLLNSSTNLFGPIAGRYYGSNPYEEGGQKALADLKLAAQVIGKYMEGGVLRKEDEIKYEKMLPNLMDKPEVAKHKLGSVREQLVNKSNQYITDFGLAGFDVSGFQGVLSQLSGNGENSGGDLRTQVLDMGYDYDAMSTKYSDEEIKQSLGI